jgi:SagB-type dehydrogenase family enzyme
MKKIHIGILSSIVVICVGIGLFSILTDQAIKEESSSIERIKLPHPEYSSNISIENALFERRSIRNYKDEPLTLAEVSQLLWAAQGITNERGFRTSPSAGALYPLELYVVIGNVEGISEGIYRYNPEEHELIRIVNGDKRAELCDAALGQSWIKEGAISIVFSAVYERTTKKYGGRGIRYVHMELGHAAQNVYLQAVSLNLGTTVVGAFNDEEVKKIIKMADEEHPLYIMPVGRV